MRKYGLIMVSAIIWASGAAAQTPAKPPELASLIQSQSPFGYSTVTRFIMEIYTASLWTDAHYWSMNQPFALSLQYHMNFSADTLVEKTLEEIKRIDGTNETRLAEYESDLKRVFRDVKKNDRITAYFSPRRGTAFYYNGEPTGWVNDPEFAETFFHIWLSPKTAEKQSRAELLNLNPIKE